jgi:hypothetical protein
MRGWTVGALLTGEEINQLSIILLQGYSNGFDATPGWNPRGESGSRGLPGPRAVVVAV